MLASTDRSWYSIANKIHHAQYVAVLDGEPPHQQSNKANKRNTAGVNTTVPQQ